MVWFSCDFIALQQGRVALRCSSKDIKMMPQIFVIFFGIISGINSQQSYFSLPSRLRFTRGEFPVPLFYQASSPTSAPASRTDLQQQFTDIFNWSKDLVNDSRFKGCPVPNISDISNASPKSSLFFGLNPQHRMAAMRLRSILNGTYVIIVIKSLLN